MGSIIGMLEKKLEATIMGLYSYTRGALWGYI